PTPQSQNNLISTWLQHAQKPGDALTRLMDPCAGKGEALAYLARQLGNTTTYGIELSPQRAEAAGHVLDVVLPTGLMNALLTEETFSLLLLNPPYDGESMTGGGKRMEYTFLKPSTRLLARGGVLVYIIPETRISNDIAKHLAGWYDDLRCFRFEEDEYQVYKQVVIFGTRRFVYKQPSKEERDAVKVWASGFGNDGKALPVLTAGNGEYTVPASPQRGKKGMAFRFKYMAVSTDDYLRAADVCAKSIESGHDWQDLVPETTPRTITPAITPKMGHVSMQTTGGLLGTNLITNDGRPMLIKGGMEKFTVLVDDGEEAETKDYKPGTDDAKELYRVKVEQKARPTLYALNADGEVTYLNDSDRISDVLRDHIPTLSKVLAERNAPRYNMDPEPWEWDVMDPLSRGRYLPGRDVDGLTTPQRHFSVALGRLLLAENNGLINGEMGSGKTTMSLATLEYLRAAQERRGSSQSPYPALVVGPGIVTADVNWPKETREVIPGAQATIIDATIKPLSKPAKIKDWAKELGIHLDVDSFEGEGAIYVLKAILAEIRRQSVSVSRETLLALAKTLADAEKHPPKTRRGHDDPNLLDARIGGYHWLGLGELVRDPNHVKSTNKRYSLAQFIAEYKSGQLPEKSLAVMAYTTAKLGAGRVAAMGSKRVVVTVDGVSVIRAVCTCPQCGRIVCKQYDDEGNPVLSTAVTPGKSAKQYVGSKRRYCHAPMEQRLWDDAAGKKVLRKADENGDPLVCGAPLFQESRIRREAAARYIQRQAADFFPSLIMDEIHQAKAKGTGNGWALSILAQTAKYALGLTGTLFSGYSTSIFWIMH
ncbi:MAG: DUF6094 domain-containing protein, partial [Chloroflexota bacterium]|nr:DUF6094 domain-containing protein [Chloroflexota bacterium]